MKNEVLIVAFLSVLCFSCTPRSEGGVADFNDVVEITEYDSLYSDRDCLFGPVTDMEISDGIIALSHRNDEYNFSFIDAGDGRLLKRWGRMGEGPNEFLDFGGGFIFSDSSLVFMEQMKKNLVYVPLSGVLSEDSIAIRKEAYPYNVDFRPVVFTLSGGYKIFGGAFSKGRLGIIDRRDSIRECLFDYPFPTEPLDGLFKGNVFQCKLKSKGGKFVVHCFSGTPEWARKFLSLGAYLGVTGMVTFNRAQNIRESLAVIPDERLLIETDSPYLAPVPHRGTENHPGFLALIAARVAEERGRSVEEIATLTTANGKRFYAIGEGI